MKIFIGADHRGYELKQKISAFVQSLNHQVIDVGSFNKEEPCDYPQFAFAVASQVAKTKNSRGILVCMTGIGHSIAANKIQGAYAALCYNKEAAILSRQHNNANILVLGSKFVAESEMNDLVKVWLETEFEGGRHLRRVKQIKEMEKQTFQAK